MTLSLKHTFQSAKGDPADATLIKPSDWNATHTITTAANVVIGNAGTPGAASELAATAAGLAVLAAANAAAQLALEHPMVGRQLSVDDRLHRVECKWFVRVSYSDVVI